MIIIYRICGLIVLLALLIATPSLAQNGIYAHFECKWWSEEQMIGIDPNNPPMKNTVVKIKKWEYSDPIGVPHPDTVSLVVEMPPEQRGVVIVQTYWRKGARWIAGDRAIRPELDTLNEDKRKLSFEIPVSNDIETIRPGRLRAIIKIDNKRVRNADLPIVLAQ